MLEGEGAQKEGKPKRRCLHFMSTFCKKSEQSAETGEDKEFFLQKRSKTNSPK